MRTFLKEHGSRASAILRRSLPIIFIIAGAAWRILWLSHESPFLTQGEAPNIAVSLARGAGVANAFSPTSGPTAHITPAQPFVAAAIYRLFGVESHTSAWLLSLIALAYVLGAAAILYHASRRLGWDRRARLLGLALFCILPLNPHIELMEFRTWEGGLAALLSAILLAFTIRVDDLHGCSRGMILLISLVAGFLFYVSPPLGLVGYINLLVLAVRRFSFRRLAASGAVAIGALCLVLTPWVIRNEQVFGTFIPLRSNFGLEFSLANNSLAAADGDSGAAFEQRFQRLHPITNATALRQVELRGEAAYSRMLAAETATWVEGHPASFGKLMLLHLCHFYFPVNTSGTAALAKQLLSWLLSVMGLLGAALALTVWRGRSVYLALAIIVPALPYALFHSNERYRYTVEMPTLFLAAAVAFAAFNCLRNRGIQVVHGGAGDDRRRSQQAGLGEAALPE